MKKIRKPKITILYHYMYPDDVVSSMHLDGLAQDLVKKGWDVEAFPCNRGCRNENKQYSKSEIYKGVVYRRVWRPLFSQHSFLGRVFNSIWMVLSWTKLAFRPRKRQSDIIIIGTDPIFSAIVSIPFRFFNRRISLVHWCFDLHPEATVAMQLFSEKSYLIRLIKTLMSRAYRSFDLIADLGFCMRKRLRFYNHNALEYELTPWALVEPETPLTKNIIARQKLFGNAKIGILYSGNLGEAHDFLDFLALARSLRDCNEVHFNFAIRGNRAESFRKEVTIYDKNISFSDFTSIDELEDRLGSADIHLVSLKKEWTGIAVPSKFFGSIAMGRPVLYSGDKNSSIAKWIDKYQIGLVIDPNNLLKTREDILNLVNNSIKLDNLKKHCSEVYKANFSRKIVTDKWHQVLSELINNYSNDKI